MKDLWSTMKSEQCDNLFVLYRRLAWLQLRYLIVKYMMAITLHAFQRNFHS